MFDKTEGAMQNVAGRIQEVFGKVMGDPMTQVRGRTRRVAGGAQYGYGEIVQRFRESAVKNPVATVAVIGGVFFVLGAMWAAHERAEEENDAAAK